MNIFVLDENVELCAQYHNDKHVVKMILETAQILSTAIQISQNKRIPFMYKPTHVNHPCTKWAMESLDNTAWLTALGFELIKEYKFRYEKLHKSFPIIMGATTLAYKAIPRIGKTPFAQAMPEEYRTENAVDAYRNYYMGEKRELASWKKRGAPEWYK